MRLRVTASFDGAFGSQISAADYIQYGGKVDWGALGAAAGVVAAVTATWQLRQLRLDSLDARAAEIMERLGSRRRSRRDQCRVKCATASLTGSTNTRFTTRGGCQYFYDVRVLIEFPCQVRRRHYDGTIDDGTTTIELQVATIPPRSAHPTRRRRLSIAESEWSKLLITSIQIEFSTPDAGRCVSQWPPRDGKLSPGLRRRITQI